MTRRRWLFLLLFLLAWPDIFSSTSEALSPEICANFKEELLAIHDRQPPYKKDVKIKPFADIFEGVDCSRLPFLALWKALRKAGVTGLKRTTASRMAKGLDGWDSIEIGMTERTDCDVAFWTFKLQHDHTGVFMDRDHVMHASASRNRPVIDEFKGWAIRNLETVRRLTIGD